MGKTRALFLFCHGGEIKDEPTSGLDAASASEIMALLGRLASETGMILITSVHQPSTRVFSSFDQASLRLFPSCAW